MIHIAQPKKYELIAEKLEELIHERGLREGDRLASVNDLCKLFDVAPVTMCNAIDVLRDRGIIRSVPRKGNFVRYVDRALPPTAPDFYDYIERHNPISSIYDSPTRHLKVFAAEYSTHPIKQLWDRIFAGASDDNGPVSIEGVWNKDRAADCDVILHAGYDFSMFSDDPNIIDRLFANVDIDDYFPSAFAYAREPRQFAALPFAVSQQMRLWNRDLAQRYCPTVIDSGSAKAITRIVNQYDYKDPDFPIVASFIHFMPFVLMEEGIDIYDEETGTLSFADERIPDILEFNRCMVEKLFRLPNWDGQFSAEFFWKAFAQGHLLALDSFSYALPVIPERPPFKMTAETADMSRHNCCAVQPFAMGIGRNSRNIEDAIRFITFACGEEGQTLLAESRSNIPALRSAAESDSFLERCPDNMESLLQTLDTYKDSALLKIDLLNQSRFSWIEPIVNDYLNGRIQLSETLKRLATGGMEST